MFSLADWRTSTGLWSDARELNSSALQIIHLIRKMSNAHVNKWFSIVLDAGVPLPLRQRRHSGSCMLSSIVHRWCVHSFASKTSKIRLKTLAHTQTDALEMATCFERQLPAPPLHHQFIARTSAKELEPHKTQSRLFLPLARCMMLWCGCGCGCVPCVDWVCSVGTAMRPRNESTTVWTAKWKMFRYKIVSTSAHRTHRFGCIHTDHKSFTRWKFTSEFHFSSQLFLLCFVECAELTLTLTSTANKNETVFVLRRDFFIAKPQRGDAIGRPGCILKILHGKEEVYSHGPEEKGSASSLQGNPHAKLVFGLKFNEPARTMANGDRTIHESLN